MLIEAACPGPFSSDHREPESAGLRSAAEHPLPGMEQPNSLGYSPTRCNLAADYATELSK